MQQRLKAIGLRPISALVDITNYFTFDQRPPVARLRRRQGGGQSAVVSARQGRRESSRWTSATYELAPANVVIADDNGLESIGGIMGGEHSGCDREHHQRADRIGATGTRSTSPRPAASLGIITDARYRFERGVDPEFMLPGIELAHHRTGA
jgi:phenylalanyl-tRNA synthetase beta chain